MAAQILTQVVSELPTLVVVAELEMNDWQQLVPNAQVVWLRPSLLHDPQYQKILEEAYRIVSFPVRHDSASTWVKQLEKYQSKCKIVLPLYSYHPLMVTTQIPGWSEARQNQIDSVLYWSGVLPLAGLIFIRDVLDWWQQPYLLLLTQQLHKDILLIPDGETTPLRRNDVLPTLQEALLHPSQSGTLIEGERVSSTSVYFQANRLYNSMYQAGVIPQTVPTQPEELLPFATKVVTFKQSSSGQVDAIVASLPTPEEARQRGTDLEIHKNVPTKTSIEQPVEKLTMPLAESTTEPPNRLPTEPPNKPVTKPPVMSVESGITQAMLAAAADDKKVVASPKPTLPKLTQDQVTEDVRKLFSQPRQETKIQRVKTQVKVRKQQQEKSVKRTALFYAGLVCIVLGVGLAAFLGMYRVTLGVYGGELSRILQAASMSSSKSSEQSEPLDISRLDLARANGARTLLTPQLRFLDLIFDLPMIYEGDALLTAHSELETIFASHAQLTEANNSAFTMIMSASPPSAGNPLETSLSAAQRLQTALNTLTDIVSQLPAASQPDITAAAAGLSAMVNRAPSLLSSLAPLWPTMTAQTLDQSTALRTYAIVFQNSQELRPTGGFMDVIAIVSVKNGTINTIDTYSTYDLDKRLEGEIEPPTDLQTHLAEQQWWLHDSNWHGDFPTSAAQLNWFLSKSLGIEADGIIALNTTALPALLQALGPLSIPEYDDELTAKNIAERLEFHSSNPQIIAASNKPGYRQVLLTHLLSAIRTTSPEKIPGLLRTLRQEFDAKNLLLYLKNQEEQHIANASGWSGAIVFPPCPSAFQNKRCFVDGIAQVEANIGANLANAYLERDISHTTTLTPQGVTHKREITYTNTATTTSFPKGPYRAYVRWYVPPGARGYRVFVNDIQVPTDDVHVSISATLAEIGAVIEVAPASSARLVFEYELPQSLVDAPTYVFYEQSQPGTPQVTPPLSLTYPAAWNPLTIAPAPTLTDQKISFPQTANSPTLRLVEFSSNNSRSTSPTPSP